jgi:hypothetical protein
LRSKLIKMDNLKKLHFFSPSQVKKLANVNKEKNKEKKDIIQYYTELKVHNSLSDFIEMKDFNGKFYKPMDDLVDSYYIKELLKNL